MLELNKLYNMDCMQGMKEFPDGFFDLAIVDPPYGIGISEDAYNKDTHTRTILKIKKVYDVSAVSYPANADTDISARSYFDGVIEAEKRETLARKAQILKIKLMMEV